MLVEITAVENTAAAKNTYGPEKPVKKYECIGQYEKGVGTRLRKKKNRLKRAGWKRSFD